MQIKPEYVTIKQKNIPDVFDETAIRALVVRVAGQVYANAVILEQIDSDGFDVYELTDKDGKLLIRANSGVSAAAAFNRYLKDCCGYSVGALTTSGTLPETPPRVNGTIQRKSRFLYRYFFNYCTFGYTYAFDTWESWEKVLDYLLLSGYNLVLNPIAVESVWRKVLLSIGYSKKDADGFLCGPAFYPWQWMMNLSGWAGGAPDWWYDFRLELAGKFNERMQSMGAGVAGVGYVGMVPADFLNYFPESKVVDQGDWFGFVRPAFILPEDPNYQKVADAYYAELRHIKGAEHIHFYAADPFHEGGRTEGIDLTRYGLKNFEKMCEVDEKAVWLIQGWGDPKKEMVEIIPNGRMLVVALCGDSKQLDKTSYHGAPWISCAVNLFGGQYKWSGYVENLSQRPFQYLAEDGMNIIGIGYMPESINCCEVLFEAVAENAFRDGASDFDAFLKHYITTKYGYYDKKIHAAWREIADKVLSKEHALGGESGLCARPSLTVTRVSSWAIPAKPYLDQGPLIRFVQELLAHYGKMQDRAAYRKDLMDAARQILSNVSWRYIEEIKKSYAAKDVDGVSDYGKRLLHLFDLQATLVATDREMLLGTWLEKAKALGKTSAEKTYFEWNARVQITLWGDKQAAAWLRDYAAKEWQGLLEDFYKPRWESFISRLELALLTGKEMEPIENYHEELPFVYQKKVYPTQPFGNLKKAVEDTLKETENLEVIGESAEEPQGGTFIDNVFKSV
ncbi:MAG: alpha-N-acetylglucosaminidase C-terminal domain-containing protein [Clostridia bacterium]|nr:alpha-N-acetylglucosaminidase C-terminal domain-containing protein [Clostridia bacterium]